jgi:hypothetical protein
VTTLHPLDTFFWALTISWSQLLAWNKLAVGPANPHQINLGVRGLVGSVSTLLILLLLLCEEGPKCDLQALFACESAEV